MSKDDMTKFRSKEEDGDSSTNALGTAPSGPLTKKESPAGKVLKKLGAEEASPSPYDVKLKVVGEFDANKLPELQQAIAQAVGSDASVKFDTESNCFYVDGEQGAVEKVKKVLSDAGVQVEEERVAAPASSDAEPEAEENFFPPDSDDEEDDDDVSDDDDADWLENGRLNDLIERIVQKIERKPAIKRAYYYRVLLKDVMRELEEKPGASMAMLTAARDFLKTQL